MSREELLAQMAASINYTLEEAHAEVYPKRTFHRYEYHAAATDPKVIAHWTRRRYELATKLLAEVKSRESLLVRGSRIHKMKKVDAWRKENEHIFSEAGEGLTAAKVLSPENQRVVPVR